MSDWAVAELAEDARQDLAEAAESLALFERKGLVQLNAKTRSFRGGPKEPVYVLTAKEWTARAWSDFAKPRRRSRLPGRRRRLRRAGVAMSAARLDGVRRTVNRGRRVAPYPQTCPQKVASRVLTQLAKADEVSRLGRPATRAGGGVSAMRTNEARHEAVMQAEDRRERVKARIHTRSGVESASGEEGHSACEAEGMTAVVSDDVVSLRQPEAAERYPSRTETARFLDVSLSLTGRDLQCVSTTGGLLHSGHLVPHANGGSGERDKLIPLRRGRPIAAPRSSDPAVMLTWADRREDKGPAI
jgi:hypothetical protein